MRLTTTNKDVTREMICRNENCGVTEEHCPHLMEDECACLREVINKLADYEDLEEQCIAENQCGLRELLLKWKEFFDDIAELYDYRKAEEQGLLLRHKLKVGDIVWDNDFGRPCAYQILGFSFGNIDEDVIEDFDFVDVVCKEVIYCYSNLSGSITGYFAESAIGVSMFLTEESALAEKGGVE